MKSSERPVIVLEKDSPFRARAEKWIRSETGEAPAITEIGDLVVIESKTASKISP